MIPDQSRGGLDQFEREFPGERHPPALRWSSTCFPVCGARPFQTDSFYFLFFFAPVFCCSIIPTTIRCIYFFGLIPLFDSRFAEFFLF